LKQSDPTGYRVHRLMRCPESSGFDLRVRGYS
jgi:hypothetical protein